MTGDLIHSLLRFQEAEGEPPGPLLGVVLALDVADVFRNYAVARRFSYLQAACRQVAAIEGSNQRISRMAMAVQAENRQVERNPIEGLLEVSAKRLLDVDAVVGQVGKVHPTPHCKQHAKKPRQEFPLPCADLAVGDGRHFCEDVRDRRREKRLPNLGSWGLFVGTN